MKKCLILGFKKSGASAYKVLKDNYDIYVIEDNLELPKNIKKIDENYLKNNLPLFDLTIISPGFDKSKEIYLLIKVLSREIISEIELGYRLLKDKNIKIIAVTGSNGKTTTVSLIEKMLKSIHINTYLLGNIGEPLCEHVQEIKNNSVVILELSSFQLEDIKDFKSDVNVITNISPNHLDKVSSYEYYIASKKRLLFNNQVLISDNDKYFKEYEVINIYDNDLICLKEDKIIYQDQILIKRSDLPNYPNFYLVNVTFALLAIYPLFGYHQEFIKVIKNFKNLPYRETISKVNGFYIMNDSKSTSTGALIEALKNFQNTKRHIIIGGIYKSNDFDKVKFLSSDEIYIYGTNKNKIKNIIKKGKVFDNLLEVILEIKKDIQKEEAIIFSPACSSFDQFNNYFERGKYFDSLIKEYFYDTK